MTSGEWSGDRAAVFERDDDTCRRCGTTADEDPAGLCLYPVGGVPIDGDVHESGLVTVCTSCFGSLHVEPISGTVLEPAPLFDLVRKTTEREGVTVSAVAAFASLTTGLPEAVDADASGLPAESEAAAEYRQARREVLLAIDSVDAGLEQLHAVDADALEPTVGDALAGFTGTATKLQSELRGIVALGESIVVGLERCQGCFEPVPGGDRDRCSTCGLETRDIDDWCRPADDTVAFESLYEAINETLQTASGTTEALTDRTTIVAERLHDA
ncbi:HNH endonuclease [Natrarchaeobaculum sulfurireducens]|uniref:HNH endonuclease n=1 Tax=Natrarchaeobaculum sulfurireducens TaxID=2044521 RepID=UPI000E3E2BEE|nr:HNH endonuclease [Natrarchaeobaculum sulfurireducens]